MCLKSAKFMQIDKSSYQFINKINQMEYVLGINIWLKSKVKKLEICWNVTLVHTLIL